MGYLLPQMDKDTTSQNFWRAVYARDFVEGEYWIGLGRRTTVWPSDSNPPDATVGTLPVEILGYKRCDYKTICVPDQEDGELQWRNLRFTAVDQSDMLVKTNGVYPRWAFVQATITTSELPTQQYFRQIFLVQDLVPLAQWDNYDHLTADQVESYGNLIYIENIPEMYRLGNQLEEISLLFEF